MVRALLMLTCALALTACGDDKSPYIDTGRPVVEAVRLISAEEAARRYYSGEVVAADQARLSFEISGQVDSVAVDIGDQFERGEVLARLDPVEAGLALTRTRAELDDARAAAEEARRNLERTRRLVQTSAASQAALDQAEARAARTQAQVAALQAALGQARERLEDTQLTAPYAGTVGERLVEPAQTVRSGEPAFAINATDSGYEIRFYAPASDLNAIRTGNRLRVRPSMLSETLDATVRHVSRSANRQGLYEVRARIEDAPEALLPGMSADVISSAPTQSGALLAPASAFVARDGDRGRVLVINAPDGVTAARDVEIVALTDNGVLIRGDIADGDIVASRGVQRIDPGVQVDVIGLPDSTARYNE